MVVWPDFTPTFSFRRKSSLLLSPSRVSSIHQTFLSTYVKSSTRYYGHRSRRTQFSGNLQSSGRKDKPRGSLCSKVPWCGNSWTSVLCLFWSGHISPAFLLCNTPHLLLSKFPVLPVSQEQEPWSQPWLLHLLTMWPWVYYVTSEPGECVVNATFLLSWQRCALLSLPLEAGLIPEKWHLDRNSNWFEVGEDPLLRGLSLAPGSFSWPLAKMVASAQPQVPSSICWILPCASESGLSRPFSPEEKKKLSIALQISWTTNSFPPPRKADRLVGGIQELGGRNPTLIPWWTWDEQASSRSLKLAWEAAACRMLGAFRAGWDRESSGLNLLELDVMCRLGLLRLNPDGRGRGISGLQGPPFGEIARWDQYLKL